jgi:hypothetical protein
MLQKQEESKKIAIFWDTVGINAMTKMGTDLGLLEARLAIVTGNMVG